MGDDEEDAVSVNMNRRRNSRGRRPRSANSTGAKSESRSRPGTAESAVSRESMDGDVMALLHISSNEPQRKEKDVSAETRDSYISVEEDFDMLALDEAVDEAEAEFNTHRSLRSSILRSRRGDSGLQTEVAVARAGYRLQQKAWEAQQRADYLRRQSDFDSAALSEEALKAKDDAERAELLARAELERRNNEGAEDGRHTFGALPDRPRQKPWPLSIGAIVSLRIAVKKVLGRARNTVHRRRSSGDAPSRPHEDVPSEPKKAPDTARKGPARRASRGGSGLSGGPGPRRASKQSLRADRSSTASLGSAGSAKNAENKREAERTPAEAAAARLDAEKAAAKREAERRLAETAAMILDGESAAEDAELAAAKSAAAKDGAEPTPAGYDGAPAGHDGAPAERHDGAPAEWHDGAPAERQEARLQENAPRGVAPPGAARDGDLPPPIDVAPRGRGLRRGGSEEGSEGEAPPLRLDGPLAADGRIDALAADALDMRSEAAALNIGSEAAAGRLADMVASDALFDGRPSSGDATSGRRPAASLESLDARALVADAQALGVSPDRRRRRSPGEIRSPMDNASFDFDRSFMHVDHPRESFDLHRDSFPAEQPSYMESLAAAAAAIRSAGGATRSAGTGRRADDWAMAARSDSASPPRGDSQPSPRAQARSAPASRGSRGSAQRAVPRALSGGLGRAGTPRAITPRTPPDDVATGLYFQAYGPPPPTPRTAAAISRQILQTAADDAARGLVLQGDRSSRGAADGPESLLVTAAPPAFAALPFPPPEPETSPRFSRPRASKPEGARRRMSPTKREPRAASPEIGASALGNLGGLIARHAPSLSKAYARDLIAGKRPPVLYDREEHKRVFYPSLYDSASPSLPTPASAIGAVTTTRLDVSPRGVAPRPLRSAPSRKEAPRVFPPQRNLPQRNLPPKSAPAQGNRPRPYARPATREAGPPVQAQGGAQGWDYLTRVVPPESAFEERRISPRLRSTTKAGSENFKLVGDELSVVTGDGLSLLALESVTSRYSRRGLEDASSEASSKDLASNFTALSPAAVTSVRAVLRSDASFHVRAPYPRADDAAPHAHADAAPHAHADAHARADDAAPHARADDDSMLSSRMAFTAPAPQPPARPLDPLEAGLVAALGQRHVAAPGQRRALDGAPLASPRPASRAATAPALPRRNPPGGSTFVGGSTFLTQPALETALVTGKSLASPRLASPRPPRPPLVVKASVDRGETELTKRARAMYAAAADVAAAAAEEAALRDLRSKLVSAKQRLRHQDNVSPRPGGPAALADASRRCALAAALARRALASIRAAQLPQRVGAASMRLACELRPSESLEARLFTGGNPRNGPRALWCRRVIARAERASMAMEDADAFSGRRGTAQTWDQTAAQMTLLRAQPESRRATTPLRPFSLSASMPRSDSAQTRAESARKWLRGASDALSAQPGVLSVHVDAFTGRIIVRRPLSALGGEEEEYDQCEYDIADCVLEPGPGGVKLLSRARQYLATLPPAAASRVAELLRAPNRRQHGRRFDPARRLATSRLSSRAADSGDDWGDDGAVRPSHRGRRSGSAAASEDEDEARPRRSFEEARPFSDARPLSGEEPFFDDAAAEPTPGPRRVVARLEPPTFSRHDSQALPMLSPRHSPRMPTYAAQSSAPLSPKPPPRRRPPRTAGVRVPGAPSVSSQIKSRDASPGDEGGTGIWQKWLEDESDDSGACCVVVASSGDLRQDATAHARSAGARVLFSAKTGAAALLCLARARVHRKRLDLVFCGDVGDMNTLEFCGGVRSVWGHGGDVPCVVGLSKDPLSDALFDELYEAGVCDFYSVATKQTNMLDILKHWATADPDASEESPQNRRDETPQDRRPSAQPRLESPPALDERKSL